MSLVRKEAYAVYEEGSEKAVRISGKLRFGERRWAEPQDEGGMARQPLGYFGRNISIEERRLV